MIELEIDFLHVGDGERSGDAIAFRYGRDGVYTVHIVDGGTVDSGNNLVTHIRQFYGNPRRIDHIVLTHADDDHSSGLRAIIEGFEIGAIWMNRPWLYAVEIIHLFRDSRFTVDGLAHRLRSDFPILADIEDMAVERRIPIYEAFQGARIGVFTVLSPARQRYLAMIPQFSRTPAPAQQVAGLASLIPRPATAITGGLGGLGLLSRATEAVRAGVEWIVESWGRETLSEDVETSASNESSVVQFANIDGRKILLTGDAGVVSLHEAADYAIQRGAGIPGLWFMQVPHHGSRRNVSTSVLNRWLGPPVLQGQTRDTTAFVSAAKGSDTHPRLKVVNAFIRRGAGVHVTKGVNKCQYLNLPIREGWTASVPLDFSDRVES